MPLEIDEPQSAWLKYPVSSGRFYIQHRMDEQQPGSERTYGPIQGDPFDVLGLEELMAEQLTRQHSPDEVYRIKLMLRTDDKPVAQRALRLMEGVLFADSSAFEKKEYVRSFVR